MISLAIVNDNTQCFPDRIGPTRQKILKKSACIGWIGGVHFGLDMAVNRLIEAGSHHLKVFFLLKFVNCKSRQNLRKKV